jgi:hypothetical protein
MANNNYKTKLGVKFDSLAVRTENLTGDSFTMLKVRRVKPQPGDEHVQIEVDVVKRGTKRTNTYSGYINLSPRQVPTLINALTKVHPPYDKASPLSGLHADSDKAWAKFYEIDPSDWARLI